MGHIPLKRLVHTVTVLREVYERDRATSDSRITKIEAVISRVAWMALLRKTLAGTEWEGIDPHALRKTLSTWVEREAGVEAAARLLGHSSPAITASVYVKRDTSPIDLVALQRRRDGSPNRAKSAASVRSTGITRTISQTALSDTSPQPASPQVRGLDPGRLSESNR